MYVFCDTITAICVNIHPAFEGLPASAGSLAPQASGPAQTFMELALPLFAIFVLLILWPEPFHCSWEVVKAIFK